MQNSESSKRLVKLFTLLTIFGFIFYLNTLLIPSGPQRFTLDSRWNNSNEVNGNYPSTAAFRENTYTYAKQLVNDSGFDLPPSTSPWNVSYEGDTRDVNGAIVGDQINSTIIGNQATFSLVSDPPQAGQWTQMRNPTYISTLYPQWYGVDSPAIDAYGCKANHTWSEGPNQAPSVWWARNVTAPVNMTDYVITSANISSVVNASVNRNIDVLNINLDAPEGNVTTSPQGPPFDFIRFYVKIADLALTNIYEIAFNQTYYLGWFNASIPINITTMFDTFLNTVSQDALIFYLNQVLAFDHYNFTIILGIDIYSADNCATDYDIFNMIRIKNVGLNFTCQKKVDQYSAIDWAETGYRINSTDYLGTGDQVVVTILNATLNFRYKLTQPWPATSPNSEFRLYVNNFLHSETVKLSNGTTTGYQDIKGGQGFDVTSLVTVDQNVSLEIQILMLDTFLLPQNCSVLIDNVTLEVFFLATVRTTIPSTQLRLVGSTNIAAPWNETFTVTANYTVVGGGGIVGANITIDWIDSFSVTDIGGGLYNVTCNTTVTTANQHYNLQILAEAYGNESQTYVADIQIIDRPTFINVFIDQVNLTSNPDVTVPWNKTVNITAFYYDTISARALSGATVNLTGTDIDPSAYKFSIIDTAYQFLLNSSFFGSGSHFISLLGSKVNYGIASLLITLKITVRPAFLSILRNSINVTQINEIDIPITDSIALDINYYDAELGNALDNYNVSLQGLGSQFYDITLGLTSNVVITTNGLDLGVYIVSVIVGNLNYTEVSHTYQFNVNQIRTNISTIDYQQVYTITPNGDLTLTLVVTDIDFNRPISDAEVTYTWRYGTGTFTQTSPGVYTTTIKNIPEGENDLYISAYKGLTYRFETKTITIVAVAAGGGLPVWVSYVLVGALGIVCVLFIQYQRVWKYPQNVRKIRALNRALKSGKLEKQGTSLTFRSAETTFADGYLIDAKQSLPPTTQNLLRDKYITKKVPPAGKREVTETFATTPKAPEIKQPVSPASPSVAPAPEPTITPSPQASVIPPTPAPTPGPVKPATAPVPPIAPIPERFLKLIQNTPSTEVKSLPHVKELPPKPSIKPAPKTGEKPAEKAGDEKK